MSEPLKALTESVSRLRHIVEGLSPQQLVAQAYPTEWKVADVLSHIGSGAVIMARRLEAAASGVEVPEGFNQSVWDEWNAKAPAAQAADALVADRSFLTAAERLTDAQRASFTMAMGPMNLDFTGFLGLRLNEHALHTWDIEVVGDATATVPESAAALIVDRLEMMVRFGGKPDGKPRVVTVHTTAPVRDYAITIGDEGVALAPSNAPSGDTSAGAPDLTMPAESLVRLVYGRLDAAHTPAAVDGPELDALRKVFPGR